MSESDEPEPRRVSPKFVERNSAFRIDPILAASIIVEEPWRDARST